MTNTSLASVNKIVWMALLAALVAGGAFVEIPLGPVPFTMQTAFVVLAGFVLGPIGGGLCICLYLLAGVLGLPVFSGGASGIGHIFGPTGGYLIGFVVCAAVSGMGKPADSGVMSWRNGLMWGALGTVLLFLLGVVWLKFSLGLAWIKAMSAGMVPFLPGAVAKLILSTYFARLLKRMRLVSF